MNFPEFNKSLEMLKSPLSVSRERAYSFLNETIYVNKHLTHVEKVGLLKKLVSNEYLFFGIDEVDQKKTSVRAFSILIINLVLASDSDFNINLEKIYEILICYLEQEKDLRAKDSEGQWLHGLAHLSDLLITLKWHKNRNSSQNKIIERYLVQRLSELPKLGYTSQDKIRIMEALN